MFGLASVFGLVMHQVSDAIEESISDFYTVVGFDALHLITMKMAGLKRDEGILEENKHNNKNKNIKEKAFTGQQVVDWLLTYRKALHTKDALTMGTRMLKHGLILPVRGRKHKLSLTSQYTFADTFMTNQKLRRWSEMTTEQLKMIIEEAYRDEPSLPKVRFTGAALTQLFIDIGMTNSLQVAEKLCSALLLHSLIIPLSQNLNSISENSMAVENGQVEVKFDLKFSYRLKPGLLSERAEVATREGSPNKHSRSAKYRTSKNTNNHNHNHNHNVNGNGKHNHNHNHNHDKNHDQHNEMDYSKAEAEASGQVQAKQIKKFTSPMQELRRLVRSYPSSEPNSSEELRPTPQEWTSVQSYGEDSRNDNDINDYITSVCFDATGKHLAIGDKAGRISIIREVDQTGMMMYQFLVEFESFRPGFDIYKSVNVQAAVTTMAFWQYPTQSPLLLAGNVDTVHLWKLVEQRAKPVTKAMRAFGRVSDMSNCVRSGRDNDETEDSFESMTGTTYSSCEPVTGTTYSSREPNTQQSLVGDEAKAVCQATYSRGHTSPIHSVCTNVDGETFLTADSTDVCIWNVNYTNKCYNIYESEANKHSTCDTADIAACCFHPVSCNLLGYGDTDGVVRVKDMRANAHLEKGASVRFRVAPERVKLARSYPACATVEDCAFSPAGRFIVSRDSMRLTIWDLTMPNKPFSQYEIHPKLWSHVYALSNEPRKREQGVFRCSFDPAGGMVVTGTVGNQFCICNRYDRSICTIKVSDDSTYSGVAGRRIVDESSLSEEPESHTTNELDNKLLQVAWHPRRPAIAVAGPYKLWLYKANTDKRTKTPEVALCDFY